MKLSDERLRQMIQSAEFMQRIAIEHGSGEIEIISADQGALARELLAARSVLAAIATGRVKDEWGRSVPMTRGAMREMAGFALSDADKANED